MIVPSRTSTSSWRITAVAPSGIAPPVEILIALPSASAVADGRSGARLADDGEGSAGLAGDDRVTVHRRARERRHVAGGRHVRGEHPIVGVGNRDPLGSKRLSRFEHPLAGLRDRDQSGAHHLILANPAGRLAGDARGPGQCVVKDAGWSGVCQVAADQGRS